MATARRYSAHPCIDRIQVNGPPARLEQQVNAFLLGGPGGILVDTGWRLAAEPHACWEHLGRPSRVLLTHAHPDHVGNAGALVHLGVPIHVHPAEAPLCAEFAGGVTFDLEEGREFLVPGWPRMALRVLETPGHTPGHVALLVQPAGILLSGDLLLPETTTWVGPPQGDLRAYLDSLRRIVALGGTARRLLAGHGSTPRSPVVRAGEVLAHRLMREEQILAVLGTAPRDLTRLVRHVYGPELAPGLEPFARATLKAHLVKLCEEGRVEEQPGGYIRSRSR